MKSDTLLEKIYNLHRSFEYSAIYRLLQDSCRQDPDNSQIQQLIQTLDSGKNHKVEGEFSLTSLSAFSKALEIFLQGGTDERIGWPKITLVTPVFNQKELLEKCIRSIVLQGYPNLEYIVMDGGSTDGSVEVIQKYEQYVSHWQSGKDDGPYAAVQEGLNRGSGEVMGWLNADDKMHPFGLYNIGKTFKEHPEVRWAAGRRVQFNDQDIPREAYFPLVQLSRETLLRKENLHPPLMVVMQEGTYWHRSLWEEAGSKLDLQYTFAADFELWARLSRYAQLHQVDALFGGFRDHSADQRSKKFWETYTAEVHAIIDREEKIIPKPDPFHRAAPPIIYPGKTIGQDEILPGPGIRTELEKPGGPPVQMVTIVLEDKQFLAQCVESVANQLYQPVEHTVIDVNPTHTSRQYLSEQSGNVRYLAASRSELPNVLNTVLNASSTEIMHIAPASTGYDPYTCLAAACLFGQNPDVEWFHSCFYAVNNSGEPVWQSFIPRFCRRFLLMGNFYEPVLQLESVFWRRSLWKKAGGFLQTELQHAFDGELWLRFSRHARLHPTPYCMAGFQKSYEGFWNRDPVQYVLEMKHAIVTELQTAGQTELDLVDPPSLLMTR